MLVVHESQWHAGRRWTVELRQMAYVIAVARHGHVTRAAEELLVAQSALSRQIQQVEREVGVLLFDRAHRRLHLTAAGQAFVARAERLLADVQGLLDEMQEFGGLRRGRVAIGALPSVAEAHLPALVAAFHDRYPGLELSLREENTLTLLSLLETGQIDLALAHQLADLDLPGGLPSGLNSEALFSEDLVLITAPDHRLAALGRVPLLALQSEPLVVFKPGSGVRHTLLRVCAAAGFTPRIAFESGAVSAMRAFVAAGIGIAVVPRSAAEVAGPPVRLLELASPPLSRNVALVWHEAHYRSAAARAFAQMARLHFAGGAPLI
jgi:LysR family hydrogen peroxide-inducible transcriptional activator